MKIGVFDSGVGGKSVATAIQSALPEHEIDLRQDTENLPYGTKSPELLYSLVLPILQDMASAGCDVIVIACNTVTTTLISKLREVLQIPLVGMEPMLKPASSQTHSGVIAVCATPATLASGRYAWLKSEYCKNISVIEPDCSKWAQMVEDNKINHEAITQAIEPALEQCADVVVLGCTHYHWIEGVVADITKGRAVVIQPEQAVIRQLKRVLVRLD